MSYYLRKTLETDAKLYFRWVNDPAVRSASFSTEAVIWEQHEKWFARMLEDEATDSFVCMDFLLPVAQVRVERAESEPETGVISYSVGAEYRGQGIAKQMLAKLEEKLSGKYKKLRACVKPENTASRKVFEDLGYRLCSEGEDRLVFEKEPDGPVSAVQIRKPRETKFEVLRVLAMLMVILLHYLDKGGLLHGPDTDRSGSNIAFWLVEALCLASVNIYVMISGYFLIDSRFTLRRLVKLWCEVFFYSTLVAAVCLAAGIADPDTWLHFYNIQFFCLPVVNGHYWFAGAYLLMYIFSPFLGAGIRRLSEQQHRILLLTLLCILCIPKSILPVPLGLDDHGVGVLWFLCLYVLAAYLRLFGIPFLRSKAVCLLVYFGSALLTLGTLFAMTFFKEKGFTEAMYQADDYNHVFVLCASVGLFAFFAGWKPVKNLFLDVLARIAPYTFGVYLLHEHLLLRYVWPEWLGVGRTYGAGRILHMLLSVLIIFGAGILVDVLRSLFFDAMEKLIDRCMGIYFAKKEVWDYLIVGFLTTLVSWITYAIFARGVFAELEESARIALGNAVAWIFSVIFAYFTNRSFVFHSEKRGFREVSKEFISFVGARLFSFGVDEGLMLLLVVVLHVPEFLAKYVLVSIAVIVLNYVLSKLWIFKKPAKEEPADEKA